MHHAPIRYGTDVVQVVGIIPAHILPGITPSMYAGEPANDDESAQSCVITAIPLPARQTAAAPLDIPLTLWYFSSITAAIPPRQHLNNHIQSQIRPSSPHPTAR